MRAHTPWGLCALPLTRLGYPCSYDALQLLGAAAVNVQYAHNFASKVCAKL